jgi:hypothetical protein
MDNMLVRMVRTRIVSQATAVEAAYDQDYVRRNVR